MLYSEEIPASAQPNKKSKAAAAAQAAMSRLPGLRDASKKQAKILPLDRPVPPGCVPLDTHSFRFVVDPNSEALSARMSSISQNFIG